MEEKTQCLEKENEAHVNLVQSMAEIPVNLTTIGGGENNTTSPVRPIQPGLTQKKSENKRLAEKSSEIKNLKKQVIVLDTKSQRDNFKDKLFVAECEVEREKTLVNVLMNFRGKRKDEKIQIAKENENMMKLKKLKMIPM